MNQPAADRLNSTDFKSMLSSYKQLIDSDISHYGDKLAQQTLLNYGEPSELVVNVFIDLLNRDSKRLRGTLTLVGYEMCGGTNRAMILQAARAVEMMHAYILIIDDIQDRSALRRGGPSAHKLLESSHAANKWNGDAAHNGISLALNSALLGLHSAEMLLANLDIEQDLRIKIINIMNHTMAVTAHGQTHDIVNEIKPGDVSLEDIENVLQWKTAHYSVLNPIHIGMVLAGAPCEDTNTITEYALHAGKAFQITDDLFVVSSKTENGKTNSDDIREGKQTLLTVYALRNASVADQAFLRSCLGKQELTEEDFQRCKNILISSGAKAYAEKTAVEHVSKAQLSLKQHASRWAPEPVEFLDSLAQYLITRST